jgi:hypothetical protein
LAILIVRHKVKDFAAWKSSFQAHESERTAAGLTNPRLFRSADDPSEVVLLLDAADLGAAKAFAASAELQSAMAAAGVMDKPDVYFLNAAD